MRELSLSPQAKPCFDGAVDARSASAKQVPREVRARTPRAGDSAVLSIGALLAASPIALALVAASWYTPYRASVIYSLIALLALLAVISAALAPRVRVHRPQPIAWMRPEANVDRMILERVLWGSEADSHAAVGVLDESSGAAMREEA
jgi:hypothetical protein